MEHFVLYWLRRDPTRGSCGRRPSAIGRPYFASDGTKAVSRLYL